MLKPKHLTLGTWELQSGRPLLMESGGNEKAKITGTIECLLTAGTSQLA